MATHRVPMLGFQTMPDSSGSVWFEPTSVDLSNESFSYIVLKYEESPSDITCYGAFNIPQNYASGGSAVVVWNCNPTTGDADFGLRWRSVGGSAGALSLVQAIQGSATSLDVAPSSASGRVETKITITAADISAGSTLQFGVSRATTGTDAAVAGPIYVHGVLFEYEDV